MYRVMGRRQAIVYTIQASEMIGISYPIAVSTSRKTHPPPRLTCLFGLMLPDPPDLEQVGDDLAARGH